MWGCRYLCGMVFSSFGYIPRSRIAGSYGSSIFNFSGISLVFSMLAAPIYSPTKSAQGFPFPTSSLAFLSSCLLDDSRSNQCELVLVSICILLMILSSFSPLVYFVACAFVVMSKKLLPITLSWSCCLCFVLEGGWFLVLCLSLYSLSYSLSLVQVEA